MTDKQNITIPFCLCNPRPWFLRRSLQQDTAQLHVPQAMVIPLNSQKNNIKYGQNPASFNTHDRRKYGYNILQRNNYWKDYLWRVCIVKHAKNDHWQRICNLIWMHRNLEDRHRMLRDKQTNKYNDKVRLDGSNHCRHSWIN